MQYIMQNQSTVVPIKGTVNVCHSFAGAKVVKNFHACKFFEGKIEKNGGRWKVEGGRCKVEGGRWKVEGGRWKVEGGRCKVYGVEEGVTYFFRLKRPQRFYRVRECRNSEYGIWFRDYVLYDDPVIL